MNRSIINIEREQEKETFQYFNDFFAKVKEVTDDSEWLECDVANIEFSQSPDANPFEELGGGEFDAVQFSPSGGWVYYPLRYTALSSILTRADISGNGIKELFLANKEQFATVLNWLIAVKNGRKSKMLALIQDRKLSALHSAAYKQINMADVFEQVDNYLFENFEDVEFKQGVWSYAASEAVYKLGDKELQEVYKKLLAKHFKSSTRVSVELLATTSDVAETAVRYYPRLDCGNVAFPLVGKGVKHIGNASLQKCRDALEELFISFEAAFRNVAALADIKIFNMKNTMIKAFTMLNVPQKHAAELCEQYDNVPSNALDVYTSMCRVLPTLRTRLSRSAALNYEDTMSRMIMWNRSTWEHMDIPGVVAWGAKNK